MKRSIRRLTFVTDAPHFGGAERYIVAMARAAGRRGIQPHIYWARTAAGRADVFNADRVLGIEVTAPDPNRTDTLSGMIGEFRSMLRRVRPDVLVINACGRSRFWLTPWLAWQAGMPAVWVQQMIDGRDHRRLKPQWFGGRVEGPQLWRVPQALRHWLAGTAASAVVTLNAEDRERVNRWQRIDKGKIRVIPHGVDCEEYRFDQVGRRKMREAWGIDSEASSGAFVVGTAGRLVRGKGMDVLIEAVALLREQGIPAVAAIAGEGVERDSLGQLASDRGSAEAVKFVGFVDDMPAFYSALDVFALCSATESFGLALAEAMACERAVVGTPTAGAMRQIVHQRNGWQMESCSAAELATALRLLYENRESARQMGLQGREDVTRQFSIDLTLERTLRALRGSARERSRLVWPGMNEAPFVQMPAEDLA